MFKRPWYSTARKKQVSYLHNFRSVQITAWPIKLVWKGEIINNFVPFQKKGKIAKKFLFAGKGKLKCAQGLKRAICVVSHKWIEPKLFVP